ncbi:T9SS type A sorting domain-containing protein [Flavobacterium aestivum]|uniref:T9SS type A sorting domain-containing protein n=1 Tax=Flavobacterium aestivum TaxID=3003257 RepID=UPI002482EEF6|nr:T9SS type A sorting domain-containing protein [Flavobacterium aestivum]
MKYLFLIFTITLQGQVLHHQMISSQGLSKKMSDGTIVRQTIGQQSLTGTSNKNYIVMQGFQQNARGSIIPVSLDDIKTIAYPNPFVGAIHFKFSKPITESIEVNVFDMLGHTILRQNKNLENNILTIDLPNIAEGEYFIKLISKNYSYTGKLLKTK